MTDIPTQAEIAGQLVDEIISLAANDSLDRELVESAVNVALIRSVQAAHERLDRALCNQRAKINAVVEPYDED